MELGGRASREVVGCMVVLLGDAGPGLDLGPDGPARQQQSRRCRRLDLFFGGRTVVRWCASVRVGELQPGPWWSWPRAAQL